jgi:hypothetical protein
MGTASSFYIALGITVMLIIFICRSVNIKRSFHLLFLPAVLYSFHFKCLQRRHFSDFFWNYCEWIASLISFSMSLFLVYRKATDFSVVILYLAIEFILIQFHPDLET